MNKVTTREDYVNRITRVVDYVYDNLDGDLSSAKLAEVACFSEYHWHRIYRSISGETIAQTIRRLRLHRASYDLISSEKPISQVAKEAGYSAVESFGRAFQKDFGIPPANYRKDRKRALYNFKSYEDHTMYDIELKSLEKVDVLGYVHEGSYTSIGKTFEKLFTWAFKQGFVPGNEPPRIFCMYYNDPSEVSEEDQRSFVCASCPEDIHVSDGVQKTEIAAGRYAVMTHKGPYSELQKPYQWLFGKWLPESGEEAAHAPCFEEYLNDPKQTPPSELLTAIYLPLKN